MTEDELIFADGIRQILNGLRNQHQTQVAGQATFEKHLPGGRVLRTVVTNRDGRYTFDRVDGGPLPQVDINAEAEEM